MQKVGAAGSYLAEEHTRKYFKQELWQPSLMNRDDLEVWKQKGRLAYGQRVAQKTINILENHRAEELRPEINEKIEGIAKRAEQELAALHFVA
jgi:trimethylamine--corrinoid protein Co-methyltransferase